jgi:outer membrane protein assembly factor BamE
MRHFLIPVLLLGLIAGCSSAKIGPHRIDVQQGNALDQENVARLKPGLNRSQVRFLLGTPLLVDPFRTDRWDYVYLYYKAGKLAEQKRVTLFFEGDTLARIEGDVPKPAVEPVVPATEPRPELVPPGPAAPQSRPAEAAPQTGGVPPVPADAPAAAAAAPARAAETSIVPPLPSPKSAPAYVDPHPPAEPSLQPETDAPPSQPDVVPSPGSEDPVLKTVNEWAAAWVRRDEAAYLAAYDAGFVPQGGDSRAEWEKRRRLLLEAPGNIELRIDSPVVERAADGSAVVTFNQYSQSGTYQDAVVKQLRLVERDGRWLIAEEKVMSAVRGVQP